jgi:hypothetical protein
MFLMVQARACEPPGPGFLPRRGFCLSLRHAFQISIDVGLEPSPAPLDARGAGGGDQQQHPRHHRRQQQQALEDHLEASMQLCSDADEPEGGVSAHAAPAAGVGPAGPEEAAGGPPSDPNELIWFQCAAAVKGMRQAEGS